MKLHAVEFEGGNALLLHSAMCNHLGMNQVGEKNAAAVALGRLGGLKGGKARAKRLTAPARKRIAKRAAAARWKKKATPKR